MAAVSGNSSAHRELRERQQVLARLHRWIEKPMLALSFVWLALLVLEYTVGLNAALRTLGGAIWVVFLIEFVVSFILAPRKLAYLRHNWLKAMALAAPALRLLRIARFLRVARAARGVRLLRVVSSLNRAMQALGATLRRRGFAYVVALTLIVVFVGAAGMYAFEADAPGGGFASYWTALWWTAMIITTMGSEYWPKTPDGRVLCLVLAIYAFSVFGYVTATLASFFVGRDADSDDNDGIAALAKEVREMRAQIDARLNQR
jgi:voltage-gated potassium channel